MTQASLFPDRTPLDAAFASLAEDLTGAGGPQISTMRNHRFALLQYDPREEFKLRERTQRLTRELTANGWAVLTLSLQSLLLDRIRAQGDDWLGKVSRMEANLANSTAHANGPERALNYLKTRLAPLVEGPDGIAGDVAARIRAFLDEQPEKADRTLALIGRAGALYPFFRSSALLKHIDGRTDNVPVVLLYPGKRHDLTGLSFMGVHEADHDYRPRIYS